MGKVSRIWHKAIVIYWGQSSDIPFTTGVYTLDIMLENRVVLHAACLTHRRCPAEAPWRYYMNVHCT